MKLIIVLLLSTTCFAQTPQAPVQWNAIGVFDTDEQTPQRVEVYESQEGVILVKAKTNPTPRPEEPATPENVPNRQPIFEHAFQFGRAYMATHKPEYNSLNSAMIMDLTFAFHPPVQKLTRITVGTNFETNFDLWPGTYDVSFIEALKNNWTVFADYDFAYIPFTKSQAGIAASIGVYTGQQQGVYFDHGNKVGPVETSRGVRLKARMMNSEGNDRVHSGVVVTGHFGIDGSTKFSVGALLLFGRKNTPKVVVTK